MSEIDRGCSYCFKSLALDKASDSVEVNECLDCGCLYHARCWQKAQSCSKCGNTQSAPKIITLLPPPAIVVKTRAMPVKPTAVIYLFRSRIYTPLRLWMSGLASVIALVFIGILILGSIRVISALSASSRPKPQPTEVNNQPDARSSNPQDVPVTPPPPSPVPTVIAEGLGLIQTQDVNLRAGPGIDYESLAILRRGHQVQILNESQVVEDSIWVKVQADQLTGWINQRYLVPAGDASTNVPRARVVGVAPERLRVRADPGNEAPIIDYLNEGAEIVLLETREVAGVQWQHIQFDQTNGWVASTYLEPLP